MRTTLLARAAAPASRVRTPLRKEAVPRRAPEARAPRAAAGRAPTRKGASSGKWIQNQVTSPHIEVHRRYPLP